MIRTEGIMGLPGVGRAGTAIPAAPRGNAAAPVPLAALLSAPIRSVSNAEMRLRERARSCYEPGGETGDGDVSRGFSPPIGNVN
jgi:hypothetical protein